MGPCRRTAFQQVVNLLALLLAYGSCVRCSEHATTTTLSTAIREAYGGQHSLPWSHSGSPATTVEKAYRNYATATGTARRFMDFSLAVAMDWELTAAVTYPMLQATYESVHPWRTGQVVRQNWTDAQGDRFAAITSALGDVLLMDLSKTALLSNVSWPEYARELRFGEIQESEVEQQLAREQWLLYPCNSSLNPIMFKAKSNTHFLPQLVWITMTLDVTSWIGCLLSGQSCWTSYEERGAALWAEYEMFQRPVVLELAALLKQQQIPKHNQLHTIQRPQQPRESTVALPNTDVLLARAHKVVKDVTQDLNQRQISSSRYTMVRDLYLEVKLANSDDIPVLPSCE